MHPGLRVLAVSDVPDTYGLAAPDQVRNDALVLQQRKLNLGRQINQASAARQVNRNYAAAAYGPRQSKVDVQK